MPLIELKDVNFSYGTNDNLEYQFDFALNAGEILAIIGKSGAGKSTLLDLVSGFLSARSGKILLDGCDITHFHPFKRRISILFQKNNLFEHLSVFTNVCFGLNPNSKPKPDEIKKARMYLADSGLAGLENRKAGSLSGGQIQRVALVRELLRDTKLILLDEPFNGIDVETKELLLPMLQKSVENGKRAIMMVTHDLSAVSQIVTQVKEVKQGRCHTIRSN